MNDDTLKTLSDNDLVQLVRSLPDNRLAYVKATAEEEIDTRKRKRKDDAIAKIKELAGANSISVSIKGARGRPPMPAGAGKPSRPAQAK